MDEDKLARIRAGDKTLFADLVREHHRALIALVVPIVGASEAEEVVQNAWFKAHRGIGSFEGRSKIRSWLARIVINEAKLQLRQRKKELLFTDCQADEGEDDALSDRFSPNGSWQSPPREWDMDTPENLLMREDLRDCLEELLEALPSNQRAVLELRDTAGLSFEEICNELPLSTSNVRVVLHRARSRVFKLVDHYEETGEC